MLYTIIPPPLKTKWIVSVLYSKSQMDDCADTNFTNIIYISIPNYLSSRQGKSNRRRARRIFVMLWLCRGRFVVICHLFQEPKDTLISRWYLVSKMSPQLLVLPISNLNKCFLNDRVLSSWFDGSQGQRAVSMFGISSNNVHLIHHFTVTTTRW